MNEKMKKFCHEYVIDLNATQAAIRAGYSEKTATSMASRMLTKVKVQELIKELQSDLQRTTNITAIRVLNEHKIIAFSSISHLHNSWIELKDFEKLSEEQKACIKSISTKVTKRNIGSKEDPDIVDVEFVKVELYDKQKSLDSISKILGFDAPTKIEQKIDFDSLTDEQVNSLITKMTE